MKLIKYSFFLCLVMLFVMLLTGCKTNEKDDKITVMTTIFPIYDFTKAITKDRLNVELILPPGVEPHSFDPKPRSIFAIRNADVFIYTGDFLEVWATQIIDILDEDEIIIVNASKDIDISHDDKHDDHEGIDPHVWVDPLYAIKMVDSILEGLIEVDKANASFYTENANLYKQELLKLDLAYQDLFSKSEFKTIIFGGHFVFGYLAKRYNIEYVSPYNGFSPDTLPTPKNIQNLINLIKTTGNNTIFYEELINPKVAKVISEETNAVMLPLNGAGNISKTDYENQATYLSIMYKNIENLKKGLNYNG